MNYLNGYTYLVLLALCLQHMVGTQPESFVIKKSVKNRTTAHLKEELAAQLEDMAHQITEQIQILAQSQKELLLRMRELADGTSADGTSAAGIFTGSHKKLQESVQRAQQLSDESNKQNNFLHKQLNFLQGN
jgi:methyl-accepting chemotaxis protein